MSNLNILSFINSLQSILDEYFSLNNNFYIQNIEDSPVKVWAVSMPGLTNPNDYKIYYNASGKSLDIYQAYIACICEYIERYSLSIPLRKRLVFSLNSKPKNVNSLSIDELIELQGVLAFQNREKYPKLEFLTLDTELEWVSGKRLIDDENVFVPHEAVWLKNHIFQKHFESTTNGCAIHSSYENALIRASLELIERDSFLYIWWTKKPLIKLNFHSALKLTNPHLYSAYGPWLKYISVFHADIGYGIPSLVAIFHSEERRLPAFILAGSANLNPYQALYSALTELSGMINAHVINYKPDNYLSIFNFDENINSFAQHAEFYLYHENKKFIYFHDELKNAPSLDFFKFSESFPYLTTSSEADYKIDIIKNAFKKMNMNPIIVDQTSPEAMKIGLTVLRCMDPKAIDLNSRHVFRRWGKKRLNFNFEKMKHANHFPHPFP